MNDEKKLKKALLEQEGLREGKLPDQQRKEIEMILEQELKRVRRMRWVTVTLWLLWVSFYVVIGAVGMAGRKIESEWAPVLLLVWIALFPMAIASSISLYVHWRAANHRELRMRLTLLEEQLNRLAGKS